MKRRLGSLAGALALFLAAGCNSHLWTGETDLIAINASAAPLTVFVDGREAFTLDGRTARTLDAVGAGKHVLEAFDPSGRLAERKVVDLRAGENYYWHLSTP
ncbi:MAG: hypothetical protein ACM3O7_03925 [Acidobacteriota bacterium]